MTTTISIASRFLSTLSLRRATIFLVLPGYKSFHFYPRSPCGERPSGCWLPMHSWWISIHALLAESDEQTQSLKIAPHGISIHALLAESDYIMTTTISIASRFLSTLSLRRATILCVVSVQVGGFLSTLSLRRATVEKSITFYPPEISIHALLAESDGISLTLIIGFLGFLSTLSLRRATCIIDIINNIVNDFYPRSPCGERPPKHGVCRGGIRIFLSTLSLRRATQLHRYCHTAGGHFYPRSPCGERQQKCTKQ